MDRMITLLEPVQSVDAIGSPIVTWTDRGKVPASSMPIRDGERFANSEVMASATHRFQTRYSMLTASVNAKWRLSFEGRGFDVVAVKELGRLEGVEITASARAD
jgi:SPP1 family predicted phage head-tail adaptor